MMAPGKQGAVFQLGLGGHLPLPRAVLQAASLPVGAVPGKTAPSQPLALRGSRRQAGSSRQVRLAGTDGAASSGAAAPRVCHCPCCPQREGSVPWSHMELGDPNKGCKGRSH